MTDATRPGTELGQLLRALGEQPLPPVDPEREAAREARMAAHIDSELQDLVRARREKRSRWFALTAAAIVLLGVGSVTLRRTRPALLIQREPFPSASRGASQLEPPRAAAPVESVVPPQPSMRRPAPQRVENKPEAPSPLPLAEPDTAPSEGTSSTLGRENGLFREAAEAARSGNVEGALAQFDELVRRHPESPLAQTALVRRFRLLAKAGRTSDAQREARRYLDSFPSGFAQGEARALIAGSADAGQVGVGADP